MHNTWEVVPEAVVVWLIWTFLILYFSLDSTLYALFYPLWNKHKEKSNTMHDDDDDKIKLQNSQNRFLVCLAHITTSLRSAFSFSIRLHNDASRKGWRRRASPSWSRHHHLIVYNFKKMLMIRHEQGEKLLVWLIPVVRLV